MLQSTIGMESSYVDWVPPESFDEYRLVKALGRGSMGQVWLAHDTMLDRLVAVKFIAELPAHDAARQRFLTEARAAARVQHPNIIAVYRVGEIGPRPYLISEFVRGNSLDKLAWPVAWPQLFAIAIGLARGLAAAHRQGVLHLDLNPANAIVSETGDVKLLDFGLARLLPSARLPHAEALPGLFAAATVPSVASDPTIAPQRSSESIALPLDQHMAIEVAASVPALSTGGGIALLEGTPPERLRARESPGLSPAIDPSPSGTSGDAVDGTQVYMPPEQRTGWGVAVGTRAVMGTPAYMPPEARRGETATPRSDVYSLGALLYALGAGQPPPFDHAPGPIWMAVAVPGIDPRFAAVVDRCLRHDPSERFASGDEVREALEALAVGDENAAIVREMPPKKRRPLHLRWVVLGGATLALALALFAHHRSGREPRSCPEGMVLVPAGTFQMGSPEGVGDPDEHPQHEVTLSAYCIDRTEVTVAAYADCVTAKGCSAAPQTANLTNYSDAEVKQLSRWCNRADRPAHPINCVDWDQAKMYCTWNGKRLPTEAEWEYAARGTDGRVYPWGKEAPNAKRLNACGSECVAMGKREMVPFAPMYDGNDGWETTAPVGSYPDGASPFGALDMVGNVGEWTADWYGAYSRRAETNPRGPGVGTSRVYRGGGWSGTSGAADRHWPDPKVREVDLGFRCARGR